MTASLTTIVFCFTNGIFGLSPAALPPPLRSLLSLSPGLAGLTRLTFSNALAMPLSDDRMCLCVPH